jgi:hypothetical protein
LVQDESTALHKAAKNMHTDTVEVLLDAGADVNSHDTVCLTHPPVAVGQPWTRMCVVRGQGDDGAADGWARMCHSLCAAWDDAASFGG